MGAFTGTLDFSANNNDVTLVSFSGTGTATRTLNLGNGTWTFPTTATGTIWNLTTTTGLTFNANGSTINLSGVTSTPGTRIFASGNVTYNIVQIGAQGNGGVTQFLTAGTIGTLTVIGPNLIELNATQTVATLNLNGTASGLIFVRTTNDTVQRSISVASNAPTMAYCGFRNIACSGGASFVANNSFDLGNNSGITINPPAGGGMIASRLQLGM